MRYGLLVTAIVLLGCGSDPSAPGNIGSAGTVETQPTCIDTDGDQECDRCMVRLRHEADELPFTGPPCRWTGRAYNTSLSCGYRTAPFVVDWLIDDPHLVMVLDSAVDGWAIHLRARITDRWSAELLDWRWHGEAEVRAINGFWQITGAGSGAFLFSTDAPPPFPIAGCEATTVLTDFDPDGTGLRSAVADEAARLLADMSADR